MSAFLDDLTAQLALYREMIVLNESQRDALAAAAETDPEGLARQVLNKQELMDRLAALEQRLEPRKEEWFQARATLAPEQRDCVDALLVEMAETIKTLIAMEDEVNARLREAMGRARGAIDTIQKKARVNKAYAAYGVKQGPKYIDRTDNTGEH